ncbi:error-prone DNA polymerase [Abyssibacter profundi]|uniref:Error-prone DNA polymerase n=1 Tax=Abyssibacter profundi TaxID=2182787 RepID=A0A363UPF5_9GAMM|nr:error-prone DNA polymerase [Abyssibacter profundi]PWN57334.1 error-prone DNA polymerase [Abyssibacter profundi]
MKAQPVDYAELHCLSNFTFLRGASHPQELVERAADLGYTALALTDECSVAGVVRAHEAASERGLPLIIGAEFTTVQEHRLVLLATDRAGYGQLCQLITLARGRRAKGDYALELNDLLTEPLDGCLLLWLDGDEADLQGLAQRFAGRTWLVAELFATADREQRLADWQAQAQRLGLPVVAAGDVHMHARGRRALQDTLTAIRLGRPIAELGYALFPNGERHLRPLASLQALYPPEWLAETQAVARRCRFHLTELRYEYPHELIPSGHTPSSWLRSLVEQGARRLYPSGVPGAVQQQIDHELALIAELAYEFFFLTVEDIVRWARTQGILCQGRGSAANSTVCYCLGITAVNPAEQSLLFERFVSKDRGEPPDIDVDFEHQRREEVIQYIYRKYGRDRAALAATVISYRPKSAIRDVGKALGLTLDQVDALTKTLTWWDSSEELPARIREVGLDPDAPVIQRLIVLVRELIRFPRHLSQHVGGFVISQGPVSALCPIEPASMAGRSVIQWDKDDLESLGMLKVDVLALGMLTAIRKCFDLIEGWTGERLQLATIPRDDSDTYAMIQRADTIGVFQIESRAQMSMLPRLKPANLYDLTIQVAIVRPGPIQGDMVHPYLARRAGREPVRYPSQAVRDVLKRTLGVPIFQEQVMQLAMVAAGFTAGEADQLRRAMAAWKRKGGLEPFEVKLKAGMAQRGYSPEFADRIYQQILGFGDYGFPESHAASFALLAYASSWLKCHHPAAFTAALLNSLPMGFYAPAQLIGDARRHGVEIRPVDVLFSEVESTLESGPQGVPAIRLGLHRIKGMDLAVAARIVQWRRQLPAGQPARGAEALRQGLMQIAGLGREQMEALAAAGALQSLSGHRHRAYWDAAGVEAPTPLLGRPQFAEGQPLLSAPTEGEDLLADYASLRFTLGRHPLALLRSRLDAHGAICARRLRELQTGRPVCVSGLVTGRQRPGTASGVIFMTLEDESGLINLVIWPKVLEQYRSAVLHAQLPLIHGHVQNEDQVVHVIARHLEDRSDWLGGLAVASRDFH